MAAVVPDYQFTFEIAGITAQRATAIRDKLTARLGEENVTVTSSTMSQRTTNYRVLGVDCSTGEPFDETVDATDKDDATAKVVGTSTSKTVVLVRATA